MALTSVTMVPWVLLGLFVTPTGAGAAQSGRSTARPAAVVSGSAASVPLALLAQTSWVTPGQAFDLHLMPGRGTPPVTQLGVSVSVYGCLSSVSAFDQSVSSSSPLGPPVSSTRSPLPLSGLPVIADGGGFDLSMPVADPNVAPTAQSGGFVIHLASTGAQCGVFPYGVYPVKVQLANTATGQVVGGFTTYLVYADPPANTKKVRLAVVLPIRTALAPSRSVTPAELVAHPSAALRPPSNAAVAAVTTTINNIATQHSGLPVTLEASPQTITAMSDSGHRSVVDQLTTLAANPAVQFASSPFTQVNASNLVASGLSSELGLQIARGSQVLATDGVHSTTAQTAGAAGQLGTWFAHDGLDAATLTQLQTGGYSQLVLPSGNAPSAPANGSTAEPFQLASSRGSPMTALAANADLAARFTGTPGNPVLAAHQLVAEVAQMYYERPNDTSPRALVAMAPTSWSDNPGFVDALMTALTGHPIIEPVTTSALFNAFATPGSCRNGCRLSSTTGAPGLPVAAIRTQRLRVNGFTAAAPSAHDVTTPLGDLVLAGESELLRPSQQSGVLRNAGAAVDAQLAQLVVASDPVTLTSQRGTIQVTVVSNARYPVTGTLTMTSDKLLFANGTAAWSRPVTVTGPGHTNIIPVTVQARTAGTSKVTVVFRSRGGALTLSSGQITVRSTATSLVGILLSLGAVAVLVVWWIRTSRKRRRRRVTSELETTVPPAETR